MTNGLGRISLLKEIASKQLKGEKSKNLKG